MNFFSSPTSGISWEKLQSLDNMPQELKDEAQRICELHIDFQDSSSYPHYCIVQFQIDANELRGFRSADQLKTVVLPMLAADNVKPLIVIKKATPTSEFTFLAVCDASESNSDDDDDDDNDDDNDNEEDVESPKSPAQSRVTSAAKQRPN